VARSSSPDLSGPARARWNPTAVGVVMAALGVALFVWLIWTVGPGAIAAGFRQIGWGLAFIIALGGLRFGTRALAWTLAVDPPARLRFTDAFAAVLSGDALGNLIPLGPLVSEPAKIAFVRGRTDLASAVTALAIENVFYSLSVAAMIAASTLALLFSVDLPPAWRRGSEIAVVAVVALLAAAMIVLWRRPAVVSRALATFGAAGHRAQRLQELEQQIYSFSSRRRAAVVPIVATEMAFHALGVLEVHVILMLLLPVEPAVLTSFVLEGANRLITVLFKFVPLRVGVDEAGSEALARVLGLGIALGATIAVARRARVLFWVLVGTALLVRHGLSARRVLEDQQLAER